MFFKKAQAVAAKQIEPAKVPEAKMEVIEEPTTAPVEEVYDDSNDSDYPVQESTSQIDESSDELSEEDEEIKELERKKAELLEKKKQKEEAAKLKQESLESSNLSNNNLLQLLESYEVRLTNIEAFLFRSTHK